MNIQDFINLGFKHLNPEAIMKVGNQPTNTTQLDNTSLLNEIKNRKMKMIKDPDGSFRFDISDQPELLEGTTPIDPAEILAGTSTNEYISLMLNSFSSENLETIEYIEDNSKFPRQHFVREIVFSIKQVLESNRIGGITPELVYGKDNIQVIWTIPNLASLSLGQKRLKSIADHIQKEKTIKQISDTLPIESFMLGINTLLVTFSVKFTIENAKITVDTSVTYDDKAVTSKEAKTWMAGVVKIVETSLGEITRIPKIKPPQILLDDKNRDRDRDEEDEDDDEGSILGGLGSMLFGLFQMTGITEADSFKPLKKLFKDGIPRFIGVTPAYRGASGNVFMTHVQNIASYIPYLIKSTGIPILNIITANIPKP